MLGRAQLQVFDVLLFGSVVFVDELSIWISERILDYCKSFLMLLVHVSKFSTLQMLFITFPIRCARYATLSHSIIAKVLS